MKFGILCSCCIVTKISNEVLTFVYFLLGDYHYFSENPYFYVYFVCATISSTYTYTWDIKMDWGLLDYRDSDYKFLREEIVYSSTVC